MFTSKQQQRKMNTTHTDAKQGARGPKLTKDGDWCALYDLPKLDDWRKN